ncbi:siderophore-interacting protein [Corynebacterium sp.]|uniref:siderophore-interacting protein n=1 Tax=Corynebacterium sp. TaxID=1720 RepID=UPI0026DF06DC|nr:siderophore-interacting protein [Corynebacterium sp.]MDO5511621.1 siderophore-interacting protein [Corynebacterium sp.]
MSFRPFHLHVHDTQRLSPHFMRITLSGDPLRHFRAAGPFFDQRIKVLFPTSRGTLPLLDPAADWYAQWSVLPEEERGHMRSYSVRDLYDSGQQRFLVIDFVLHLQDGATGPAAQWAHAARPGDPIIIVGPGVDTPAGAGIEFLPGDASAITLVGDETAVPAMARILSDLPDTARGSVVVEVPTDADILPVTAPESMRITWLPRQGQAPGQRILEHFGTHGVEPAAEDLVWETPQFSSSGEQLDDRGGVDKLSPVRSYFWIAGESGMVTSLRRHLVRGLEVERSQVAFMGYWKQGVSMRG